MAKTTQEEPKATQNDVVMGMVTKRYLHAKEKRAVYAEKWDKVYDLYRFQIKNKVEGRSNLFIPYAFSNVETVFPRLVSKSPRVNVVPVGPNDLNGSLIMKSLIEFAWEKYNVDETVRRLTKGALIYGTGIAKVTWKKEVVTHNKLEAEMGEDGSVIGSKEVSKRKVVYDGPCVSNLDLKSVYPDPDGYDVDSCRYIIHKYMATEPELSGNPSYSKELLKQVTYGFTNDEIQRGLHNTARESLSKNECEVLEYWEDDRLVVVAGGVVLRDEPNPYAHKKKPFVVVCDHQDDQVIYGVGEVEPIEGLQNEMNTLRNMRMDFNTLSLNPTFMVRAGSVADINSVQFRPGWKIVVNGDATAVRPVELPQSPMASFKEEESIKMDLQTVTGVSDYSKGNEGGSLNDTATGISLIQEAANQRFNAKLQNLEFGLQRIAEFIRDLYLQFITKEMVIRITEKDGYQFLGIKPEDIAGEYDIRIESGSTVPSNKIQERNEEMNKYNVLTANPLIQGSPEALLEVTRGLLEKWQDPAMENIIEALSKQVEEINAQKEEQKRAMEEEKMMAEAQRQAELQVGNEMKGDNGMPTVPDGMETPVTNDQQEAVMDAEGLTADGEPIPEEFMAEAREMLLKGKGPMKGETAQSIIDELANS